MSEKRKKISSFCLRNGATTIRVGLYEADQWEDGEPCCYRVNIDGRWHDAPDGSRLWLDVEEVGVLVSNLMLYGSELPPPPALPPKPVVHKGQPVSLPCGPFTAKGEPLGREVGRISSEDVLLGYDGQWYVIAGGVTRRLGFVAYGDIKEIASNPTAHGLP